MKEATAHFVVIVALALMATIALVRCTAPPPRDVMIDEPDMMEMTEVDPAMVVTARQARAVVRPGVCFHLPGPLAPKVPPPLTKEIRT
jgi:hypothetical protein